MNAVERAVAAEIKRVGINGASALELARAAIETYEKTLVRQRIAFWRARL